MKELSRSYNYSTRKYEVWGETEDKRIVMKVEEPNKEEEVETTEVVVEQELQIELETGKEAA